MFCRVNLLKQDLTQVFVINTTLGILGFIDVAEKQDLTNMKKRILGNHLQEEWDQVVI